MSISKSVRWRKRRGESNFYSSDSLQLRLCIPSRQEYDICYPWVTSDSCCSDPLFHPEKGKDGRTDGGKRWWDWWWKRVFAQVTSRQCSFASRWLGMARWQLFRWYAGDCVGQVHQSGVKKRQKHRKWEADAIQVQVHVHHHRDVMCSRTLGPAKRSPAKVHLWPSFPSFAI